MKSIKPHLNLYMWCYFSVNYWNWDFMIMLGLSNAARLVIQKQTLVEHMRP